MRNQLTTLSAAMLPLFTAVATAGLAPPPSCGDCFENNGTPGCEYPDCEAVVCTLDPFCCSVAWDSICADEAINNCTDADCDVLACDTDASGSVDSTDIGAVVACFGHAVGGTPAPCDAQDLNGDNIVNILDISICTSELAPPPT